MTVALVSQTSDNDTESLCTNMDNNTFNLHLKPEQNSMGPIDS